MTDIAANSNQIEHRLIKLEVVVDGHKDELETLKANSATLTASLMDIEKTLTQLKWLAIGIAIAVFAKEIGIDKVFKVLFGIG